MPRLAANISLLFTGLPFLDRFEAAASAGFRHVECQFPYEFASAEEIRDTLRDTGLEMVLINAPCGEVSKGEFGLAGLAGGEARFRASVELAVHYLRTLDCHRIHLLAGKGRRQSEALDGAVVEDFRHAADAFATVSATLMIEALNPSDQPGYRIASIGDAVALADAVDRPNVKLQFDLYHLQKIQGELSEALRAYRDRIGHVQLAGVPHRQEPDEGELNTAWLLGYLDEIGYDGFVGCEYKPRAGTSAGLGWARPWGIVSAETPPRIRTSPERRPE